MSDPKIASLPHPGANTRALEIAVAADARVTSLEQHYGTRWGEANESMKDLWHGLDDLRKDTTTAVQHLRDETTAEFRSLRSHHRWQIGIVLLGLSMVLGGLYKVLELLM